MDSASSTSFASERLAQRLRLPRSRQLAQIAGIGGISHDSMNQTVVHFAVAPVWSSHKALQVEAFVLPKVTGELPVYPVPFHQEWGHLSGIRLADPDFGCPGNVDVLLGADVFSSVCGPPNSPTAFETCFGWALSGAVQCSQLQGLYASHHVSALSVDDTLRKFWEVEEPAFKCPNFSEFCYRQTETIQAGAPLDALGLCVPVRIRNCMRQLRVLKVIREIYHH